jgi:MYXO-CTERM domain-containing protein
MGGVGGSLCSYGVGVLQSDGASGGAFALLMIAFMWGVRRREVLSPEDYRILVPVLGSFIAINMVLSWVIPILDIAGHFGGLLVGTIVGMVVSGDDDVSSLALWLERGWNLVVCVVLVFGFLVW